VYLIQIIIPDKITNKISPKQEKKAQTTPQLPQLQPQLQSLQTQIQPQTPTQTTQVQQLPNYNQMYQNQPIESFEPYAANEAFGGMGTNF